MIAILNGLFENVEVNYYFSFFVCMILFPFIRRFLHA